MAVVLAPVPQPDLFMVDRYICAAKAPPAHTGDTQQGRPAPPPELMAGLQIYRDRHEVVTLSVQTIRNCSSTARIARPDTVLAGQSGVGKSR
jgi:putative ribosome biogenesis GTPase RsgA